MMKRPTSGNPKPAKPPLSSAVLFAVTLLVLGMCCSCSSTPSPAPAPARVENKSQPVQPSESEPQKPADVTPQSTAKPLVLDELWETGSGYSDDIGVLTAAQNVAGMQVFGKVEKKRALPAQTIRPGVQLQFLCVLVRVEKVKGDTRLPPDSVSPEGRDIGPGDTMWFYSRVTRLDGEVAREELISRGEYIWAAFEKPPAQDTKLELSDGLALAWTTRANALKLSRNMP